MAIQQFGNTWWGKEWLNALENIDYDNRLPRGKTYARNGSTSNIEIKNGEITAKVQGSQPRPYKVAVKLGQFNEREIESVLRTITENPLFLSALLSRQVPSELHTILQKEKSILVFPKSWKDMKATCSCPDHAVPCKHIASVIYLIANEIDKNPFVVFSLKGLDIPVELEKRGYVQANSQIQIQTLHSIWTKQTIDQTEMPPLEPSKLQTVSLHLPDLLPQIGSLLTPKPVFYSKGDFKEVLLKAVQKLQKEAKIALLELYKYQEMPYEKLYPETVKDIKLLAKDNKLKVMIWHEEKIVTWSPRAMLMLNRWLKSLAQDKIHLYQPDIQLLAFIRKLALLLVQHGAIIPQIYAQNKQAYAIRWLPALLVPEVRQIIENLAQIVPPDIFEFQDKSQIRILKSESHISELLSVFITDFVHETCFYLSEYSYADEITKTFLIHETSLDITQFEYKEVPQAIFLWLRHFFFAQKTVKPVIKVEEDEANEGNFLIEVLIETGQALQEPEPLFKLFQDDKFKADRFSLLQDLAVLGEYFVQIKKVLASKGIDMISLNPQTFSEVFTKTLPIMNLLGISVLLPKALQKLLKPQTSLSLLGNKGIEKHYLNFQEMLKYKWEISIGDQNIPIEEFLELVKNTEGIVKIRDQYVLIDPKEIAVMMKKLEKQKELNQNEMLQAMLSEEYEGGRVLMSAEIRKWLKEMLAVQDVPLPSGLQANLRPYQERGFAWLYKNSNLGFGSIIADDMGLGKTLQVITLLLKLKEEGKLDKKKALVVVPTTLLTNWQKEIQRFAPNLHAEIYHGAKRQIPETFDLLITTYGILRSDEEKLGKMKWYVMAIDEAQNIKNPSTAQTQAVKKIKSDVRIAMSGTPVENRLTEYWSIMDFTNKKYLGSQAMFQSDFAYPIEVEQDTAALKRFKRITEPFLLRRMKTDKSIITDLPDKIETDEYCHLTKEQAALYENVVQDMFKLLEKEKDDETKRQGLVFKLMTALKQICNHPSQFLKKEDFSAELSGKAQRLVELLEEIYERQEKVLIFSQYTEMGGILAKMHQKLFRTEPLFLHGSLSRKQRDEIVETFQNDPQARTMILSIKAGGTGLNLTKANHVIHYDLWWNPAVENQATDRAYRIGQKSNVLVHRFITQGTFEEKINTMIRQKKDLANLTVGQGETWIGDLSDRELKQIVSL